jgi:site-specific recombinase XerD
MKNAIEQYLSYVKLANRSENTVRCYRSSLEDFVRVVGDINAATLTIEHIEQYLLVLYRRKASKATVCRALAILKAFCKWLVGEGVLSECDNPAAVFRSPRRGVRIHQRANEAEIRAFLDGPVSGPTMNNRRWNKAVFFPERDRLILELLYGSGLRCDECANLRVDDFIEPDKLVVSKGKGNKERYVFLTDAAISVLGAYLEKRQRILANRIQHGDARKITALFFGLSGAQINALSTRHVYRIVVKYAKNAGLPWLSPHDLRRAFATHMDEHGAPHVVISRLLGHAKLSTTDLYIAKASLGRVQQAYDRARRKAG